MANMSLNFHMCWLRRKKKDHVYHQSAVRLQSTVDADPGNYFGALNQEFKKESIKAWNFFLSFLHINHDSFDIKFFVFHPITCFYANHLAKGKSS